MAAIWMFHWWVKVDGLNHRTGLPRALLTEMVDDHGGHERNELPTLRSGEGRNDRIGQSQFGYRRPTGTAPLCIAGCHASFKGRMVMGLCLGTPSQPIRWPGGQLWSAGSIRFHGAFIFRIRTASWPRLPECVYRR